MKKIFAVSVSWQSGGTVFIEARNIREARGDALQILRAESAIVEPDYSQNSQYDILEIREVEKPEDSEKKNAGENAEALKELQE